MKTVFWVIDDTDRTWIHREKLKANGCKWDKEHKAWTITDPTETFKKWIQSLGLALKWRRDEA